MPNTQYTRKLEERRNSTEVQNFKNRVTTFLNQTNASPEIRYRLQCDLSKKIDMPFYGDKKQRVKRTLSLEGLAKEYIRLLIEYNDISFSEELLHWIIRQQNQTLRRLHKCSAYQKSRKAKFGKGVYEHPVPANYSCNFLLSCIANKDYLTACEYIDYMSLSVPQVFLTTEEDRAVNKISRDDMPKGWDFRKDSPYIRYIQAEIPEDVFGK